MPNIAKILKEEIARISRKETKSAVAPLRKPAIKAKKELADLKTRTATMEKELRRLTLLVVNLASTQPVPAATEELATRTWISGKGVKSLRKKLGLTQAQFGKLTGVTLAAVNRWESKPGTLKLRKATMAAIMSIRGIGKVEAKTRLAEQGKSPKRKTGSKRRTKRNRR